MAFLLSVGCAGTTVVERKGSYDKEALDALVDGLMYELVGDMETATDLYREAARRDSSSVTLMTTLARAYFAIGDVQRSHDVTLAALSRSKDDLAALENLADIQIQWRRYDMATETLIKILTAQPADADIRFRLITLLEYQGRHEDARIQYEELLRTIGPNRQISLKLSEMYVKDKDYAQAIRVLKQASDHQPLDDQILDALGQAYALNGQVDKAVECYEQIIQKNPAQPLVWARLGSLTLQAGEYRKAIQYYGEAEKTFPSSAEIKRLIGFAHHQLSEFEEARSYLELAVRLNPRDIFSWNLLAGLYRRAREWTPSDDAYENCLLLEPNNDLILNNYAYSLAVRGKHLERALQMIERALKKQPNSGHYLDTIGWIYYKLGQHDHALRYVQESFAVQPGSWEVCYHLSEIHQQLGHVEDANRFRERARQLNPNFENEKD